MNEQAERLFHEALDREPVERSHYLRSACGADTALRLEVEQLLADYARADAMLGSAIGKMAATFTPEEGARVGPYRLLRRIGEGGMGVVFLAERADGQFEQQVAIKFVQGGAVVTARFLQERQILARLMHPNIARLIDGGVSDEGVPYMVMEYCEGMPLTDYCQERQLPLAERLRLFRRVCSAVEHAHRSLIIHRDLKPSNILVTLQGELKLLDFGIAKLHEPGETGPQQSMTATGMHFFTPDYASPEQIRGEPVTTATDVYSLGAVLFELLSGKRAHALSTYTPAEITHVICQDPAPALGLGNELDQITQMALRKEPERRYESVAHLSEDVGRFLNNYPVLAKADSRWYRVSKFVRRNRVAMAGAALGVACLVGGLAIASWQAAVAQREAAAAQRRFEQVRKLARTVLFDFDEKIRSLAGATEARELLAKTAVEYMDSLYADALGDAGLRRELAAAYERIGDVQGQPGRANLGQRKNAIRNYARAAELGEGLAQRGGLDSLALARVYLKLHDVTGSIPHLERGVATAETAQKELPENEEAIRLVLQAFRMQGNYHNNRSDSVSALKHYRQGLQVAEQWQARHPGESADTLVATLVVSIASAALRGGDGETALASADRVIAIREKMAAAHPNNADHQRALFKALLFRADALGNPDVFHLGRTAEAVSAYRMAVGIAERMLQADPNNALARGDVSDAYRALAVTITESDPQQALGMLKQSLEDSLVLVRGSKHTLAYLHNAANSHVALARALRRLDRRREAATHLIEAVRLQRSIADARPGQPGLRHNMIATLTLLGHAQMDLARWEDAAVTVGEAVAIANGVERNRSFRGKIPDLAAAYAAAGRLKAVKDSDGSGARASYQKGLALLDELERSGVGAHYMRTQRAPIEQQQQQSAAISSR
jgi:tetratricopeptide (TPR) repeat protein